MDLLLSYLGVAALIKNIVWFRLANVVSKKKEQSRVVGHVKDIYFYPVKLAKHMSLQEVTCTTSGLTVGKLSDRGIAVATPEGHAMRGLRHPVVKTLQTSLQGHVLHLKSKAGGEALQIDLDKVEATGTKTTVVLYYDEAGVYDCGEEAATWISDMIGRPGYRLVYCGPGLKKRDSNQVIKRIMTNMHFPAELIPVLDSTKLAFADVAALHLVSQETLDDISNRIGRHADVMRFRPNIVVEGVESPYEEDRWRNISVGDVQLNFEALTIRCPTLDLDPETGMKDERGQSTKKALSGWRTLIKTPKASRTCLGISCAVVQPGIIRVGDPVVATVDGQA